MSVGQSSTTYFLDHRFNCSIFSRNSIASLALFIRFTISTWNVSFPGFKPWYICCSLKSPLNTMKVERKSHAILLTALKCSSQLYKIVLFLPFFCSNSTSANSSSKSRHRREKLLWNERKKLRACMMFETLHSRAILSLCNLFLTVIFSSCLSFVRQQDSRRFKWASWEKKTLKVSDI